ncbi:nascent polypeptide-associated complex protein [Methanosalsum natronophilum]|uniref:nascent polypeptide-associated complex protein n=1 Tax=Methanosalsum natronophilum TaxID=768733 RepID=UPI002169CCA3|nr:nascent polypeptide-associated complex protein [Methanosalsum natronophilum]MCS3924331.1 nascent polypeptide-associated complex subunit alpha [Methanosalsum natronophilum]
MIPGMGGRGMNPAKMKQMMKQMGINVEDIDDVQEVIIKTTEKDIVFDSPKVSIMTAQGTDTYQIVGKPKEIQREIEIPEDDIRLVTEQTGKSHEEAHEALKEANGDLAEAIMKLSE